MLDEARDGELRACHGAPVEGRGRSELGQPLLRQLEGPRVQAEPAVGRDIDQRSFPCTAGSFARPVSISRLAASGSSPAVTRLPLLSFGSEMRKTSTRNPATRCDDSDYGVFIETESSERPLERNARILSAIGLRPGSHDRVGCAPEEVRRVSRLPGRQPSTFEEEGRVLHDAA